MAKIPVYHFSGKKEKDLTVSDAVFGVSKNDDLLHQVYTVISGNLREATAHTKNRAERAGSGKKPWKQKGTGRARVGSVRSPLWRKGGVIFGPRNERNYNRSVNVKMRRKAVAVALSERVRSETCVVLALSEEVTEKTKDFVGALEGTGLKGSTLIVLGSGQNEMTRALRNIDRLEVALAQDLNVYTILQNKNLILTEEAVKTIEQRLGEKKQ